MVKGPTDWIEELRAFCAMHGVDDNRSWVRYARSKGAFSLEEVVRAHQLGFGTRITPEEMDAFLKELQGG